MTTTTRGGMPGKDTPTSDKAHDANAGQVEDHQNRHSDCASTDAERKALAGLQAAFALRGWALCRLADSTLAIERWGHTRTLDGITQAVQFLQTIGGRV